MNDYYKLMWRIAGKPVLQVPRCWPEALVRHPDQDEVRYFKEWNSGWRPFVIEQPSQLQTTKI